MASNPAITSVRRLSKPMLSSTELHLFVFCFILAVDDSICLFRSFNSIMLLTHIIYKVMTAENEIQQLKMA